MEILKKNVFEVTSRLVRDQREYINNSEREREREGARGCGVSWNFFVICELFFQINFVFFLFWCVSI